MRTLKKVLAGNPIASGIVTSVLFMIFFQPIIETASNIIGKFAAATGYAFISSLYKQAASTNSHSLLFAGYSTFYGMIIGVIINVLIKALDVKPVKKLYEEIAISRTSGKRKTRRLLLIIIIMITMIHISLVLTVYPVILRSQFENDMDIIAPYMSDEDYKQLSSKWRLMNNYDDYNSICQTINEVKAGNYID